MNINESIKNEYKFNKSEVIKIYETTISKVELNKWSYMYVINAYITIKEYNKAYNAILEYEKVFNDSKMFIAKKCKAIYNIFVLNSKNDDQMFKAIDFIIKNDVRDQYSIYNYAALKAVDHIFNNSKIVNYQKALRYIMVIDPLSIDDSDDWMKNCERANLLKTKREKFFGKKIKVLYNIKDFEGCLNEIEEAKRNIRKFHGQGLEWLYYREVLCYLELNNIDKAIEIVENNLKNFNHWCKYELLYKGYKLKDDSANAIKYLSMAARIDNSHKGRVALYKDAAKYLISLNENEIANYHLRLVVLKRENEGWKQDNEIQNILGDNHINQIDEKAVLKKLRCYWEEAILKNEKIYKGIINKVMDDKKSGFIKDDEGNSYYFNKMSFRRRVKELNIGANVEFILAKSFDKKKGIESLIAQQILIK